MPDTPAVVIDMNPNRVDLFKESRWPISRVRHAIFCRKPDIRKTEGDYEHISCTECDWFHWGLRWKKG